MPEMFSTFPESLYSTAGNNLNNKGQNNLRDSQPIPATIRRPFHETPGSVDRLESPELLRVRSPQSLQRVAFDIATLRQPFQATKNGNDDTDKSEDILSETESHRDDEVAIPAPSSFASEPTSSRTEISRKTETLVA